MPDADNPRSHYGLIRTVAACLDDEATIATDVGQHQMWVAQAYPLRRPRQWLTSGGLGTMGFGVPAAIGAALAEPQRTVVCFSGDGSILMNIQELVTAAEENANVKVVLMNNASLGLVYSSRRCSTASASVRLASSRACPISSRLPRLRHGGRSISTPRPIRLRRTDGGLRPPRPLPDPRQHRCRTEGLPMVPPGAANKDMIGG
jgi:acetolactate synthase-1/2/3 large subunit